VTAPETPDPWQKNISDYLAAWGRPSTTVAAALLHGVNIPAGNLTSEDFERAEKCLENIGWVKRPLGPEVPGAYYYEPDGLFPSPEEHVMRTHNLKTLPSFYAAIIDGSKTFEVRDNDRDFAVGDKLVLRETEPGEHGGGILTGRETTCLVTYVLPGGRFGIAPHVVVMGIKVLEQSQREYT